MEVARTKRSCAVVPPGSRRLGDERWSPRRRGWAGEGPGARQGQSLEVIGALGLRPGTASARPTAVGPNSSLFSHGSSGYCSPGHCSAGLGLSERAMGSSLVVSVTGEVDIATTVQLSQALGAGLRRGAKGLVCDLTGVSFLGAAGMTTLLLARQRAVAWGTWFDVVCPQPTARRVIALLGLDAVLSLHDGVAEAVDDQARRAGRPSREGQSVPVPVHAPVACETPAGGSRPPRLAAGQLVGRGPLRQKSQDGRPTQGALP